MASTRMELTPQVIETLVREGFAFNERARLWVNGHGGRGAIDPRRIMSLRLWEIDQVIIAAKQGRTVVRIGCRGQKLTFVGSD